MGRWSVCWEEERGGGGGSGVVELGLPRWGRMRLVFRSEVGEGW